MYDSHVEHIKKELQSLPLNSSILEFGAGRGSGPIMHDFCKKNKTSNVYCFETDYDWYEIMSEEYGDLSNYKFVFISEWDKLLSKLDKNKYDLALVDQAPWSARLKTIDDLKDRVSTFILHDYNYYNSSHGLVCNKDTFLGNKYLDDYELEEHHIKRPPTLIMRRKKQSEKKEPKKWKIG